jgi:hypothetical protein
MSKLIKLNPTKNKDTLQTFQEMKDKYDTLCQNYNGLTEKHREKVIISREDTIRDLKRNYCGDCNGR